MTVPFFDLQRQYTNLQSEIDHAVAQVLKSGHFILGPQVAEFEKEVVTYMGAGFAVGVASGTDALLLALRACGVGPGDEVITTPFTFVATIETIIYAGAKPVFADIEPFSMNISIPAIEKKITKKTKALLPVHLFGYPVNMPEIMKIAKARNLKVVEDMAQGIGATIGSAKAGRFGDASCLSFFPTKNLGAYGDGGMVVTSDAGIADEVKVLRGHGSRKTYYYDEIGTNSRLDEIQAAILRVKMRRLDESNGRRREHAAQYRAILKDTPVTLPGDPEYGTHVYHQYTLRSPQRDALRKGLEAKGIGSMVYYPLSLHLQKAYAYLGYHAGDFPESEKAQAEVLSLPIFPELTNSEIQEVAQQLKAVSSADSKWPAVASAQAS